MIPRTLEQCTELKTLIAIPLILNQKDLAKITSAGNVPFPRTSPAFKGLFAGIVHLSGTLPAPKEQKKRYCSLGGQYLIAMMERVAYSATI